MNAMEKYDENFARRLQEEYDQEVAAQLQNNPQELDAYENSRISDISLALNISPVDPSLEFSDPNPDIRVLFLTFNAQFFWGKLSGIEVKWSPRMTLCAGLCVYEGQGGLCSVRLSLPLLKLRPRKDLVETLLHEMIHAYLFITNNDRDHDGHGPQFQKHMNRINQATGANISIYHTFHDEVESYQQHWWRCDGPCQNRKPFFGYVKRAMNRAPSAKDFWWSSHQASCGGTFTKIKEPEGYGQKKGGKKETQSKSKDIRSFGNSSYVLGSQSGPSGSDRNKYGFGSSKNPATIFNFGNKTKQSEISTSSAGSSKNPATIFNFGDNTKQSKISTSSAGSSKNPTTIFNFGDKTKQSKISTASAESSKSNTSGIFNGVLHRKGSSLFSSIGSSKNKTLADSKLDKCDMSLSNSNSTHSFRADSKLGQDNIFPSKSAMSQSLTAIDDDDDVHILEQKSLGSLFRECDGNNNVNKRKSCEVNSWAGGSQKFKDLSETFDNSFVSKKNKSSFIKKKKIKSVCEGGVFDQERKKGKKYILDNLDSNDGLWDVPSCDPSTSGICGTESNSSVVDEANLTEHKVKKEGDANASGAMYGNNLPKINSAQSVKSEKQVGISQFFTSSSRAFSGTGHRLGSAAKGTSFLSQIRKNMFKADVSETNARKVKSESHTNDGSEEEKTHDGKRSSEEAFIYEISDDSRDVDEDSSAPSFKKIKRETKICLGEPQSIDTDTGDRTENETAFSSHRVDAETVTVSADDKVDCPVCGMGVIPTNINDHLDVCLQT